MKNFSYIFLLIIIFAVALVQAKSPPPGSGAADVPANILLMLDTSGSMADPATAGTTRYPTDVAFDSQGNIYVSIYYDYVEKYSPTGEYITRWGGTTFSGVNGRFDFTYAIAIDAQDNVYVSDMGNARVQKFDSDGNHLQNFNLLSGNAFGVTVDNSGNVYAVNGNGRIEKFSPSGTRLATSSSSFNNIRHITFDPVTNSIFAARSSSQRVSRFDLNLNYQSQFSLSWDPIGIEADKDGNLIISRSSGHRVYRYTNNGTLLNTWGNSSSGSAADRYNSPRGIGIRADNTPFVADYNNHRIKNSTGSIIIVRQGNAKTLLKVMQDVIKNIVSDSNLTSGANFGLMSWSTNAQMLVNVSGTGAQQIYNTVDSLTPNGWTYLDNAMSLAKSYFLGSNSPINPNAPCQQNILIVISDGFWEDNTASDDAKFLYDNYGIKTFTIGFATAGNENYITLSQKGGTYPDSPLFAEDESSLLDVLANYIRQIISTQLTFTVPTIIPGITNNDNILQSTFMFKKDHQWKGRLLKYSLNTDGSIGSLIWDAGEVLNNTPSNNRNIWSVATGLTHSLNNFNATNLDRLRLGLEENLSTSMTDENLTKLIDFIRGKDSYNEYPTGKDDENQTLISGERWKLADIYHSKAVAVGKPSAFFSDVANQNSETYYRSINNYKGFRDGASCGGNCSAREEVIYVGSNSGMLHAFSSQTGQEKWAFVPPGLLPNLRNVISSQAGKSVSIYGVDGSPAVKDIFINGQWKTILLAGLRQGGGSYFALDITNPDSPKHLFSFAYNKITNKVSYFAENGTRLDYDASGTIPAEYDYSKIGEAWSDPLILNIKIGSVRKWVGVFGGGYNNNINPNYGNYIYVIDLEDGGKVIEKILIPDSSSDNQIVNSIPPRLSAVTADTTTSFPYSGAYIYFTDLEGSMWKVNLSDNGILYQTQRIFNNESNSDNDRMCYHQLTPTITPEGKFIAYFGTADMARIGRVSASIANRAFGIMDSTYPNFAASPLFSASSLQNVTANGSACPIESQRGWFINLDANEKITASATLRNKSVIFSRYKPDTLNLCSAGTSKISEHEFICGTKQREVDLGQGMATEAIVYKDKLYIGISSDAALTTALPIGFVKQGNLIIGKPVATPETKVNKEYWREEY